MRTLLTTVFVFLLLPAFSQVTNFKTEQQKNKRVRTAYREKEARVKQLLATRDIDTPYIFIRVFKKEEKVELWAKNKSDSLYKLVTQYAFCATSGTLGPKRREGDYQIPEGFYHIDRFNPWSSFYLSMGINYPNKSDRILGYKPSLGGDIFIHGDCATIGCIPITDDKIKELYVFAVEAKNNGQQKIPFHIFPTRLTATNLALLKNEYEADDQLMTFWQNLKPVYDYFEARKTLPQILVTANGRYQVE